MSSADRQELLRWCAEEDERLADAFGHVDDDPRLGPLFVEIVDALHRLREEVTRLPTS